MWSLNVTGCGYEFYAWVSRTSVCSEWHVAERTGELKEGASSDSLHWVMMCSIPPSLWEPLGWASASQQSRPSNSPWSSPQPPPHHTYNTLAQPHSFILSAFFFPLSYLSSLVPCHQPSSRSTKPAIFLIPKSVSGQSKQTQCSQKVQSSKSHEKSETSRHWNFKNIKIMCRF